MVKNVFTHKWYLDVVHVCKFYQSNCLFFLVHAPNCNHLSFYAMKGVPNRLQVGNKVAMYHAYFTLFMVFVYYGFMSII